MDTKLSGFQQIILTAAISVVVSLGALWTVTSLKTPVIEHDIIEIRESLKDLKKVTSLLERVSDLEERTRDLRENGEDIAAMQERMAAIEARQDSVAKYLLEKVD